MLKQILESFLLLFIVFDAIGNAPVFHTLTAKYSLEVKRKIYSKSVTTAGILLIFFMIFGVKIFNYYGITLTDLKIAGGILLFILAIEGLLGVEEASKIKSEDIAIVPLATPLLAGPGSIYMVMYLASKYGYICTITSIILNVIIALLIFNYSSWLLSRLGRNVMSVISRIRVIKNMKVKKTMLMIKGGIISWNM